MKIENEKDFINADTTLNLEKVSGDEIEIEAIDEIWDGPLSGTCFWNNKEYFFFSFDQLSETEGKWPRKYLLIELTPEQMANLTKWRAANNESTLHIDNGQLKAWFESEDENGNSTNFLKSFSSKK